MPKKVFVATVMRPRGETGVQTHANVTVDYLRQRGRAVELVTPFSYHPPLALPVFAPRRLLDHVSGTASVWWYRKWHFELLRAALRRSLSGTPDAVVYAQCPLAARAALDARRGPEQPVVMIVHFNLSQAHEWALRGKITRGGWLYRSIRRFEADVLPRLDGIVFASEFLRGSLLAELPGVADVPYALVPSFVDDPGAVASPTATGDLISVGTLEPRKNQSYLLNVVASARRAGHAYSLTVVGDGEDRQRLRQQARALGIEEQVRFLGFQPNASRFVPGHRVYTHSALIENSPMALVEALAHGIPVLAAPVGGIPELFDDGVEGLYWSLDDPDGGAAKLISVLEDASRWTRMGRAARSRFERANSPEILIARLVDFLDSRPRAR